MTMQIIFAIHFIVISILLNTVWLGVSYQVPTAKVEVFYPKGFQVSIPHEEGITLFAFHGKLNEEMDGLEAGRWSKDILKPKDNRWIFRDAVTALKVGDILYYWTYVLYNGEGYREDNGEYMVKEYTNNAGITPTTTTTLKVPPVPSFGPRFACQPAVTIVNGSSIPCAQQLIFEEEFDGNILPETNWTKSRIIPQEPDYEFCLYLDDVPEVLKINNGVLSIRPKATEKHFGKNFHDSTLHLGPTCTGDINSDECSCTPKSFYIVPPFISATLTTKHKFSFKYGSVEVRAKMPSAMWVYPKLWLEPQWPHYGDSEYRSGQMRIAQSRMDGDRQELLTGLVLNSHWNSYTMCLNSTPFNLTNDFHTYQMLWTPDAISFIVDGREYCRYEIHNEDQAFRNFQKNHKYLPNQQSLKTGSLWAPFDQEFSLVIGLGIGGHNDFHDGQWSQKKPWGNSQPKAMLEFRNAYINNDNWLREAEFQVEYIRIYSV